MCSSISVNNDDGWFELMPLARLFHEVPWVALALTRDGKLGDKGKVVLHQWRLLSRQGSGRCLERFAEMLVLRQPETD